MWLDTQSVFLHHWHLINEWDYSVQGQRQYIRSEAQQVAFFLVWSGAPLIFNRASPSCSIILYSCNLFINLIYSSLCQHKLWLISHHTNLFWVWLSQKLNFRVLDFIIKGTVHPTNNSQNAQSSWSTEIPFTQKL